MPKNTKKHPNGSQKKEQAKTTPMTPPKAQKLPEAPKSIINDSQTNTNNAL